MKLRVSLNTLLRAFYDCVHYPMILVPSVVLWILLLLLSEISVSVSRLIESPVSIYAWFLVVSLGTLFIISFIAAGLIGLSWSIVRHRKASISQFLTYSLKFGLKNFVVFVTLSIMGVGVWAIAHYGALFLGKSLDLGLSSAQALYILIYFIGIAGFLIFFSFASFYLVIEKSSLRKSFVLSRRLVSREYPFVLSTSIVFFILFYFIDRIQGIVGDLVIYGVLVPLVSLFLTRFVLSCRVDIISE